MPDAMLEELVKERESKVSLIHNVTQAAHDAGRDLSEQDMDTITRSQTRIEQVDRQLAVIGHNYELDEQVRARLAAAHPEQVSAPHAGYRTFGEVLYDRFHLSQPASRDRYEKALTRAAQHMGTLVADTTTTAGDVHGIVIDPIVGPVISFNDGSRPLIDALGARRAPGYNFNRPYITDGAAAAGTAKQTAQKAELPSTALTVNEDVLTLSTYGEYLNISQQLLSLQPQGLQTIIDELRLRVARGMEKAAFTELALSTSKVTLALTDVTPAVSNAIEDAKVTVYTQTGMPATWILMGPTGAARLGKVADSAARPLYPFLGPSNAQGTNGGEINGLRPIVSYAVTNAAFWVGNGEAFEVYEYPFPLLDNVEPSVFGRQLAVATGAAFYRTHTVGGQIGPTQIGP